LLVSDQKEADMSDAPLEPVEEEPTQTDNSPRPEDGEQYVSQDPNDDYAEGVED
jgi:hypothetical protein